MIEGIRWYFEFEQSNIHQLNFEMLDEAIPVFCAIVLMRFTFNIGIGMTAGFVLFPIF